VQRYCVACDDVHAFRVIQLTGFYHANTSSILTEQGVSPKSEQARGPGWVGFVEKALGDQRLRDAEGVKGRGEARIIRLGIVSPPSGVWGASPARTSRNRIFIILASGDREGRHFVVDEMKVTKTAITHSGSFRAGPLAQTRVPGQGPVLPLAKAGFDRNISYKLIQDVY